LPGSRLDLWIGLLSAGGPGFRHLPAGGLIGWASYQA
jgi:hypothetical protein